MASSVFVGIDLAWSSGWTGVAVADEAGRLVSSDRFRSDDEIDAWLRWLPGRPAVVAVDAPLVVPNPTGQRVAERLIGQAFSAFGASAHSSNQRMLGGQPSRALRLAHRHGWTVDPAVPLSAAGPTVCLEVYPHPALVGLLRLPYRLDYKKGSTQRRRAGFDALLRHVESMRELDLSASTRWAEISDVVAAPTPGALDRVEDEVDAIVCAHLAWRWCYRPDSLQVYGDLEHGYIVAPPPPSHRPSRPLASGRGDAGARPPMARLARVVSGGQTGADRAGIDAAIANGLEYGGWCPSGGWAEDHPTPPGLLASYPHLREAPSADPAVRTALNVRDSHATLIVRDPLVMSPGADLTVETARRLARPCLVTEGDGVEVSTWLRGLPPALTLNVAGPRESEQPGVYRTTRRLLDAVLAADGAARCDEVGQRP